jgi:hypothetical protein
MLWPGVSVVDLEHTVTHETCLICPKNTVYEELIRRMVDVAISNIRSVKGDSLYTYMRSASCGMNAIYLHALRRINYFGLVPLLVRAFSQLSYHTYNYGISLAGVCRVLRRPKLESVSDVKRFPYDPRVRSWRPVWYMRISGLSSTLM